MKIALINPPDETVLIGNNPVIVEESRGYNPPLGLIYLGTTLKRNNSFQVDIIDCQVEGMDQAALSQKLELISPDIVGITVMTFTLLDVIKTIKTARKSAPSALIVLGGPHVHIFPKESASLPGVDFVFTGEADFTFRDFVEKVANDQIVTDIPGLGYRKGADIILNPPPAPIEDLDDLPIPDRRLLPYKKYDSVLGVRSPVTTMFTSRGCPYRCLFCDRPHLGKNFRARSAKSVIEEFQICCDLGIGEILVYDDTFTVDRQRVMDICQGIIDRKLDIYWDIRARVNTVDKKMLKLLKKAGCRRIHYGVEAGTEKILKILRKDITLDQARRAFSLTKKVGIETLAYFMIGSPSEKKEDIEKTINFARKLDPDFVHITITTPFPGTPLYALALEKGLYDHDLWRDFAADPREDFVPPIWDEYLCETELQALIIKAYQSFYLRPSYILKRLRRLGSWDEARKKIKAGLRVLFMKIKI